MYGVGIGVFQILDNERHTRRILNLMDIFANVSIVTDKFENHSSTFGFLIEEEGNNKEEIEIKIKNKAEKLNNFLIITCEHSFHFQLAILRFEDTKEKLYTHYQNFNDLIAPVEKEKFEKYLVESPNENELLLVEAMDTYLKGDYYNAFPKLVNWLEDNTNIQSKFCPIRDSLSHKTLAKAKERVESQFPNEFEFEGNIFKRKSEKNKQNIQKYLPEVIKEARKAFYDLLNK